MVVVAEQDQAAQEQEEGTEPQPAVLQDQEAGKEPNVAEGNTGQWFTKAIKEAGKGVVKAGVDVVSSVIVKALRAYTTGAP